MKKTSYIALAFLILLCFSILPSLANPQMNISSSGTINYPATSSQIKILRQTFQTGSWSASKLASIIDVYQAHYDALGVVPQIKAIRPDVLALVYFNTMDLWLTGYEYIPERVTLFKNNGWILKDAGGNYVKSKSGWSYFIDIGHPGYHAWLANWCEDQIVTKGLDGVSLDNWFCDAVNPWLGTYQTPINPRTGNTWTDADVTNAFKAMTLKIRQVIGSSKIILVNGMYNGARFWWRQSYYADGILNGGVDAVMSEGWICTGYDATNWVPEDMWKQSIDFAVWMENNFPSHNGKYFMPIHADTSWFSGHAYPSDMTQAQYEAFVLYGYASRLLTVNQLDTMMALGYYTENAYPQSLFKINIGTPSESYHTLGSSHVYTRKFSGGMVLVNPTYDSYTVTIGSGYKNAVTGSNVSSTLTVQPHTGLTLTKA